MAELEEKLNAILGNPQAMGQIMALAQSLGAPDKGEKPPPDGPDFVPVEPPPAGPPPPEPPPSADLGALLGDLDPALVEKGLQLLGEYRSGDGRREALLQALRPFLDETRQDRLDRAVRIARLSRVIALALKLFRPGGEEAGHV
ncbi:MAG TPA: hypothetical protein H9714_01285 [Candidatus Flavonifractor intestinipullorum]|uniref:Collagen alpha-1(I) chain (Alpha-1 type I collagen) n=1 Tax=Candidatus Flavonifractor intestinipullorum TaxID=2838587 RepID=A0A9D2M9N4_9FIRM|nr:hypothetical protein [Candidatus Flavonifractor intestinipullorum]